MKMMNAICNYVQRADSLGFWVECDGNEMTATKNCGGIWSLKCRYWTGKKKTFIVPTERVIEHVEAMVQGDPYAVYSLFEKPTHWDNAQIRQFMDKLPLKMCDQSFLGFTLTGDDNSFKVTKHPHSFVTWRINGEEATFQQVLLKTQQKLMENVYWVYTEI